MFSRRRFLRVVSGAFALALCPALSQARAKPPNIVLLFVDDFGWGDYKYRRNLFGMPNIDRLAADSVSFTDAYAASPTCSPSRASVITGRHPARLRMVRHVPAGDRYGRNADEFHTFGRDPAKFRSRNWLPLEETSVAEAVKPLGYRTAFVGKWHLGHEPYHPIHQGFDVQFGVTNFGHPRSYLAPFFKDLSETYRDVPEGTYLTDRLTDDAVRYIEGADGAKRFLLTLFYYAVHDPHHGRKDLVEKYKAEHPGRKAWQYEFGSMVGAVDESVGRIRAALEARGMGSNTVIFFVGDQGGKLRNYPLTGTKKGGQALYEGGARVPFLVHWPGVAAPGTTSPELVLTTDIFPTIVAMAGGSVADLPELDGMSLVPVLRDRAELGRKEVVLYRSYEDQYAAVRRGRWKLIAYRSGRAELFDVEADLSEKRDLSADRPDEVRRLEAALRAFEKKMDVPGKVAR
jgi:arylsulfatase A-like enzyme